MRLRSRSDSSGALQLHSLPWDLVQELEQEYCNLHSRAPAVLVTPVPPVVPPRVSHAAGHHTGGAPHRSGMLRTTSRGDELLCTACSVSLASQLSGVLAMLLVWSESPNGHCKEKSLWLVRVAVLLCGVTGLCLGAEGQGVTPCGCCYTPRFLLLCGTSKTLALNFTIPACPSVISVSSQGSSRKFSPRGDKNAATVAAQTSASD